MTLLLTKHCDMFRRKFLFLACILHGGRVHVTNFQAIEQIVIKYDIKLHRVLPIYSVTDRAELLAISSVGTPVWSRCPA